MRSAATNPAASPIPPAHTRGTPRSLSSSISCSALFAPACPPARRFTAIRPRTPESSPFSAHLRSVTSWYTRPPTWATRSTTQRGLPGDDIAGGIRNHGLEVVLRLAARVGDVAARLRRQRAAGLFQVGDGERGGDAARTRRQARGHRQATRHLGEIGERYRMDRVEVVPHRAAVGHPDPGVARAELQDVRPYRAGVWHQAP